jgi:hypothetical protein
LNLGADFLGRACTSLWSSSTQHSATRGSPLASTRMMPP